MALLHPSRILNDLQSRLADAKRYSDLEVFARKFDNAAELIAESVGRLNAEDDAANNLSGYDHDIGAEANLAKVKNFALNQFADEYGEESRTSFFADITFGLGYASAFSRVDLSDEGYLEIAAAAYWHKSAEIFEECEQVLSESSAPTP